MVIHFFIVLLGLCGFGLVLCGLFETVFFSGISHIYHVIPLSGEASVVENTVRKALHSLKGQIYFVDLGLDAEAQMSVELLLRGRNCAVLCAPEQLRQNLRWENEFGTGIDQGNSHYGDLSK